MFEYPDVTEDYPSVSTLPLQLEVAFALTRLDQANYEYQELQELPIIAQSSAAAVSVMVESVETASVVMASVVVASIVVVSVMAVHAQVHFRLHSNQSQHQGHFLRTIGSDVKAGNLNDANSRLEWSEHCIKEEIVAIEVSAAKNFRITGLDAADAIVDADSGNNNSVAIMVAYFVDYQGCRYFHIISQRVIYSAVDVASFTDSTIVDINAAISAKDARSAVIIIVGGSCYCFRITIIVDDGVHGPAMHSTPSIFLILEKHSFFH